MKKIVIALIIIAAVVGIVLYVKSRKKDSDSENKNADKALDNPEPKNKTMSPAEAVNGLKMQPNGTVVAVKKSFAPKTLNIKGKPGGKPNGGKALSI
jgi:flagellar basal body-associated protein FliL